MAARVTRYPGYDVLAKWDTPSWDDATRRVVAERLEAVPERRHLEPRAYAVLEALCDTVFPQPDRIEPIPIAPWVDAALHENRTNGTRWAELPPMREAWRRGLAAFDAEARARRGAGFPELDADARADLLRAVDQRDTRAAEWEGLDPQRLFRDVMAGEMARIYYAHPEAWSEIGFGGPASPRGYVRLGPDRWDDWEAGAPEETG
jgi:hypothetical protein